MRTALIGATGFVGGNLLRQTSFDDGYHSRNIHEIAGRSYDLIVCAGARAEKWRANKEPEQDLAGLTSLMEHLGTAQTKRFVLVSTVDVYPSPEAVYEDTPILPDEGHAYGRHRLMLEQFVASRFPSTIVRLPGLFGHGLKKNVIFDLLHQHTLPWMAGESRHQYYDLSRLWADLQRAIALDLALVNFATEPVEVRAIARECFGVPFPSAAGAPVVRYDMRTRHAKALGGTGDYLESANAVLRKIRAFVETSGWSPT